MKKTIAILLLLAAAFLICGCDGPIDQIEVLSEDFPLTITENNTFSLRAKKGADIYFGVDEELLLTVGESNMRFTGSYGFYASSKTFYHSADITGDGIDDHILTLSTDAIGEGACGEELHVFDGKTFSEIPVEPSFETVNKKLKIEKSRELLNEDAPLLQQTYETTFKFTLDKKDYSLFSTYNTLMADLPFIDSAHEFFTLEDGKIVANQYLIGDRVHVLSLGVIKTAYKYKEGKLILGKSRFEKEKYQLYNNPHACETGNENWRLIADYTSNKITLKGEDLFEIDLPVYFHDKVYYTPTVKPYAIISENEKYMAVAYIRDREAQSQGCYQEAATTCVAVIDLEKGEIIDSFSFERADILKAHGVSDAVTAPYEFELSEKHSALSIIVNMKSTDAGILDMGILLVSDDKQILLTGSAQYDLEAKKLSEYKAHSKFIGDNIPVYESDDIEDINYLEYLDSLGFMNDNNAKKLCATAFLKKDTTKLEELLGCREGVLEKYKDFEFEDPHFTIAQSNLILEVKITKSSLETVPIGDYTITFERGRWGEVYIQGLNDEKKTDDQSLAKAYTNVWIDLFGYNGVDYVVNANEATGEEYLYYKRDILLALFVLRQDIKNVDDYKKAAKDILGLDELFIPETSISPDDGSTIVLNGHGNLVRPSRIISESEENGIITVRVQTYADFHETINSHVYEFKYEDHGEYLKYISIELIHESEYDPEDRYIC